jgi:hypothetical protein
LSAAATGQVMALSALPAVCASVVGLLESLVGHGVVARGWTLPHRVTQLL